VISGSPSVGLGGLPSYLRLAAFFITDFFLAAFFAAFFFAIA
jgi:hypothetical protein